MPADEAVTLVLSRERFEELQQAVKFAARASRDDEQSARWADLEVLIRITQGEKK